MLDRLGHLVANDAFVKVVFDHVRNLALAALVAGAGLWRFKNPAASGWWLYVGHGFATLLIVIGLALFFLNQLHAQAKIRQAGAKHWVQQVFALLYGMLSVVVVAAILARQT